LAFITFVFEEPLTQLIGVWLGQTGVPTRLVVA
jgi:hypothetical protein